jgi:glycosyltransferase involved in cell wall biosynthesis
MKSPEPSHCVIIPSFNSGDLLKKTVLEALQYWERLIVVDDGSTDGSFDGLCGWQQSNQGLTILMHDRNMGKGAAVITGMNHALENGFTHAAVFDADGQHAAADLRRFIDQSRLHPEAMILGVPIFDEDAPTLRVKGRLVGNWWTNLETLWGGVRDSLYGFRVYPIEQSLQIMRSIQGGRRFDFDTQLAVRLYWKGIPPLNLHTPVTYKKKTQGGVSHFKYIRDNLLLVYVHTQLVLIALTKIPRLVRLRCRGALDSQ